MENEPIKDDRNETAADTGQDRSRRTRAHRLESDLRHWLGTLHEYDRHDFVFTVGDIEDTITNILGDD